MISRLPKVSVIIPVFNAENYLNRCLDSICNQTITEIEIICINDASTDGSLKILQEYAQNYSNVVVINLETNQGESAARNCGLAVAKGEYLGFVDNDDEIDNNFYEKLYSKAKENDADIVKGQAVEIDYNGNRFEVSQLKDNHDKFRFAVYWWTAIYKRSLIANNNISFSTKHCLGGDLLFLNKAVIAAKGVERVSGVYYYYHRREDSGDSKILPEAKIKSALNIFELITDNIDANIPANVSAYNFVFHNFIMACFHLSLKSDVENLKRLCAISALKIFNKCRDQNSIKFNFDSTAPHFFELLKNNDQSSLENALIRCKSRVEFLAAGLRARIKKSSL